MELMDLTGKPVRISVQLQPKTDHFHAGFSQPSQVRPLARWFATGLRSGRPMFVPLLRENKTPGCPIQRVLENDFVVVTGTGTARDFVRLLTVELH